MDRYGHEKKSLYIAFVDFKQAFDTIWHCGLLYKLLTSGISNKFYNIIKSMYCNTKVAVQDGDGLNISPFLAPPAERQRSFSNADSSVVRRCPSSVVNFSIKSLISQKLSDNFFSFLACSFLSMVPMHIKNMDLVESPAGGLSPSLAISSSTQSMSSRPSNPVI